MTTPTTDWLRTLLTKPEGLPDKTRLYCCSVHRLLLDGETWTAATDGKGVVFVRGDCGGAEPDRGVAETLRLLFVVRPGVPAVAPDWAALKAWLGLCPRPGPCPACLGTSAKSEHVFCSFCDGDGVTAPGPRPGLLCGVRIDRNLLVRFVGPLEGPAAVRAETPCVVLVAEGWRVRAIGMSEPEPGSEFFGKPLEAFP